MTAPPPNNEDDYALRWPLHALARSYAEGSRRDGDDWWSEFQALVSAGHGGLCEAGLTVWDQLQPSGNAPWIHAPKAAALLVKNGFNPLQATAGKLEPVVDVFLGTMGNNVYEQLGWKLLLALAELDRDGRPMLSEDGGNFLHVACASQHGVLSVLFDERISKLDLSGRYPKSWVNALDNRGHRPLDLIWGPEGKWAKTFRDHDPAQVEIDREIMLLSTADMVRLGADISSPNVAGFVIAKAIHEQTASMSDDLRRTHPQLGVALDHWYLEGSTPTSAHAPRTPRL